MEDLCWNSPRGSSQDHESGVRSAITRRSEASARRPVGRVVRSVRRKCRLGTSCSQPVSRENEPNRPDTRSSSHVNFASALITGVAVFTCQLVESYLRTVGRCATCAMGMMGMFKWLKKDIIQRERNGWNSMQKQCGLNNESYRNALQAFIDRRRFSDEVDIETPISPDKKRADFLAKNNNNKCDNERKSKEFQSIIPGVPHVPASDIFEIGWVAGTEDRYLELIFAEWQNTRVSLKRHTHPECKDAVKADLDVLSEIRHANVFLLMATTQTDDHGIVSIFESVDCTLYHYIHDQGERIPIQGIAKCGGTLSDALRHSHMRGYVHTAISSHCVYLASSGIVKLGGWELAMHVNGPKPDKQYQERLRTEIFRWQAPEIFQGCEPSKASDVYGLTLLIWEMCTMHVPWSGYSKVDVERQYVHWKRGVMMDLYNFPPLLNNLLEAGLQLDASKRTLDMNRMRRFLQRLEMQYEDEEPVYIDQYVNNNNETGKTYVLPMNRSPIGLAKSKGSRLTRSLSSKHLYSKGPESPTQQYLFSPKQVVSKQSINSKTARHVEQANSVADIKSDFQKNVNLLTNVQNNYKKSNSELSDAVQNDEGTSEEAWQPWNMTYKKVKIPVEIVDSGTTSVYSSPLLESTDDESFKDARTNLKQLKKVLANRREHFFYGSDSSHASGDTSPQTKNVILNQAKNKDYEPHKPASHKTSFEPKYNKSPGQYDSSCMKSSFQQCCKIPCLHTADNIKDAIARPQILNSDSQDYFETSLWRKEKLICLSKMRKNYNDNRTNDFTQHTDENHITCSDTCTNNQTTEPDSSKTDYTYVINRKQEETSHGNLTEISEITNNFANIYTCGESLQDLKNALDRAKKIVRSITPNTDESRSTSPFKSYKEFDITPEDGETCKSVFEDLYSLQRNDNEEIKPIERATTKSKTFLFGKNDFSNTTTNDDVGKEPENEVTISITSYEKPSESYDTTYSRNFVCESIAEVSYELNSSLNDTQSDKKTSIFDNTSITVEDKYKSSEHTQNTTKTEQSDIEVQTQSSRDEKKIEVTPNFNLMFPSDVLKRKNCISCHQSALPRRRSLPAALSLLKGMNNSALGKLPIRRGDIPDNTVEDLYIDDEFGGSLNVNMVLLDEDLSIDEDFLTDISEL